jgi:RNA polymerase sigma-70 factor (ECF subfamily)
MPCDTVFSEGSSGLSLAHRLAEGSAAAWSDLVELYGPLLDRWCRAAGVPRSAVADVAQETFLAVFRGIEQFDPQRPDATFRGWLWSVARNRIRDYFRRHCPPDQAAGGSGFSSFTFSIPELPEEPSESADISALVRRGMLRIEADFEPKTWQMFLDAVVLGHPTDVVAERHHVGTATVRQAKSRVLRRLRQELGDA